MGVDTFQINLVKPVDVVKRKDSVPNGYITTREWFGWFGIVG